MADLTPVERGVLLTLMSAGRPLRENADFKAKYGFAVKPSHRNKLKSLGLVRVTEKPWTHELTDKGWAWAQTELAGDTPKGLMGLGALYAVLNGLHRVLSEAGSSPREFFRKGSALSPPASARDADLAEAAWSGADETLALALQSIPSFDRVLERHSKGASGETAQALEQIRLASGSVLQHVRLAASKRGLKVKYERAARAAFDPVEFNADDTLAYGAPVEVLKSPVVKELGGEKFVVIRGWVEPVD
jgi:hypothetical protein